MQARPRVNFLDINHSAAIEQNILKKIDRLDHIYPHLTYCDVVVRQESSNNNQGKLYRPRINICVPGDKINIHHAINEDVYVAIRDAFEAAERALKNYAHKQRGDIKFHSPTLQGRIARIFDQGFGFITCGDEEYYFNEYNCHHVDFDKLRPNMLVDFTIDPDNPSSQAKRVHLKKRELNGH